MCAAGTPGDELYILLTGPVGVYSADGTELAEISPIATIGEMSLASRQQDNNIARVQAQQAMDELQRRVLIVDDDEHVRKMLTKFLDNYDVVVVGSGAEAIETAMESKPDFVITDIRMPDMDGCALPGKLPEFYPNFPVLALSGFAKDEDIKEYDFDVFLPKPMEQFRRVVVSALAGASTS